LKKLEKHKIENLLGDTREIESSFPRRVYQKSVEEINPELNKLSKLAKLYQAEQNLINACFLKGIEPA
jgi:hypothetical protein